LRYLSLAGFLLSAAPLWAQEPAETPLKMIIAVWPDTTGAPNTVKHMSKGAKDQIAAYAVFVKNEDGTAEVRQRYHNTSFQGVQSSDIIDRAIARLSPPATSEGDSASAYAPSGQASQLSPEDLKKIEGMFGPGESALMFLSPAPAISQVQRSLGIGAQGDVEIIELSVKE
jgi:hypothetical protein